MDPARPAAAALVVDGDRIAAVLDDPADAPRGAERVDLDGGCVLPGFTDAHVHFPSWALARRELDLLGARSLAEAVARVAAAVPRGGWIRGRGWRDELWPPGDGPTRARSTRSRADVPVALRAHDSHSLWLNSPALALAGGDLETPGGVVERDADGEPTGDPARGGGVALRGALRARPRRRRWTRCARRCRRSPPPASSRVHDKDGGRGAPALFAALRATLPLRGSGSRCPPTASTPSARARLRQGVHGRHARLAHRAAARRRRASRSPSPAALAAIVRRAAAAAAPGRGPRDRRPRQPRGARRLRGDRGDLAPARAAPPDRARAVRPSRRRAALRPARRHRLGPVHPRHRATATSPTGCGASAPRTPIPTARCSTRARGWPAARTRRSSRSTRSPALRAAVLRTDDERPPWRPGAGDRPATPRSRRSRRRRPGSRARRSAAGGSRPGWRPTSSCSTAIRTTTSRARACAGTMLAGHWQFANQ